MNKPEDKARTTEIESAKQAQAVADVFGRIPRAKMSDQVRYDGHIDKELVESYVRLRLKELDDPNSVPSTWWNPEDPHKYARRHRREELVRLLRHCLGVTP